MVDIERQILSQIDLTYGTILMPKGFEIDNEILKKHIIEQNINSGIFGFSKEWDKLNTYLREHYYCKFFRHLINKNNIGLMFKPYQSNIPDNEVDKLELRNSADYVMLYGVDVENCKARIYYDDNRRAGRSWDMDLETNKFIMFPSTQTYHIENNQKEKLNFILKIHYEYI